MLAAVSPASYISYAFSCLEALHNTCVASPTVPSRLSLNYHPFRQEVSIQASWAYISVTSNVRGLSSVFQEYDLRSPLLKKRPDSIKDSALIHQHSSPPVHGFTIGIVKDYCTRKLCLSASKNKRGCMLHPAHPKNKDQCTSSEGDRMPSAVDIVIVSTPKNSREDREGAHIQYGSHAIVQ